MKAKFSTLLMIMVLISLAFVPATSAQPDEPSKVKYNISKDKALDHAQAHMIDLVATNTQKFENWKGATISNNPLELYDINGKKLYYLFSVYNDTSMVGRIKVAANKTLGHSVKTFNFDPKPIEVDRAKDKSIAIANKKYPKADIKSTKMVVYSYPKIGSMTVVTDKSTGDEHRIFVDAYTLDVISDKTPTKTESGVWSMYGQIPKEDVAKNVNKWYDSNNLTKSIKQEFETRGIDISKPLSTNNLKDNQFVTSSGLTELDVPLYGQEKDYYCAPASGQMIASYYNKDQTQDYIYGIMDEGDGGGVSYYSQVDYYRATNGCDKPGSDDVDPSFAIVVSEIDAGRPMVSGIDTSLGNPHVQVCRGYTTTMYGLRYLSINDPWPVGDGDQYLENWGTTNHITDIIVKD